MSYNVASGNLRIIGNGTTTVAAASIVDVLIFTRNPTEVVVPFFFGTDQVLNAELAYVGALAVSTQPEVGISLRETANAGEQKLTIKNANVSLTRTVDWLLLGITP